MEMAKSFIMIGGTGTNCDDHPYSEKLGKLLEKSFVKLLRTL